MKIIIKEVRGCGAAFVLDLFCGKRRADKIFFKRFNNVLSQVFDGNVEDIVLYTYGVKIGPERITLNMTDVRKRMAKVDGLYNQDREDQRCAVVLLECDAKRGTFSSGSALHLLFMQRRNVGSWKNQNGSLRSQIKIYHRSECA